VNSPLTIALLYDSRKMNALAKFAACLLAGILLLSGCQKKRPSASIPQAPPTAETTATTTQPAPVPPPAPTPQPEGQATTTAPAEEQPKVVSKPKPKPKRKPAAVANKSAASTRPAEQTAKVEPPKPPVTNPAPAAPSSSTNDEISVGMAQNEAARQRQSTEDLLQATDAHLKGLTRPLSAEELATVQQIRNYVVQARAAMTDNDLVRANNLAVKAHLLSDSLVAH
jgi:outer membrane biosynthesis protein TonB